MYVRHLFIALALLAIAVPAAQSVAVSGFVGTILGPALPGVGVRLARTGLSATSDASGNWSIAGQVNLSVGSRPGANTSREARVVLENGHLFLRFGGNDALGRMNPHPRGSSPQGAGRIAADSVAVDTLHFLWKGAVVEKRPLMAWQVSGMKVYIDTIGAGTTVTPGPSGVAMPNPIPLADFPTLTAGMKKIPARNRTFLMGLKDSLSQAEGRSLPQHPVSFSYDWYMDSTEVTAREYARVMTWAIENGYAKVVTSPDGSRGLHSAKDSIVSLATLIPYGGASSNLYVGWNERDKRLEAPSSQNYPMVPASWFGGVLFANIKSLMAGLEPVYSTRTWKVDYSKNGYRLPTEAEWEYSARSGTTTDYYWGNSTADIDRFAVTSGYWSVGWLRPNSYGLYDMIGNGSEYCNDRGGRFPSAAPRVDPTGPADDGSILDSTRVFRGNAGYRLGTRMFRNLRESENFRLVLPVR